MKRKTSRERGDDGGRGSKTINLAMDRRLLEGFEEVASVYGHGKQKGLVLSAAVLMFLEADPREQQRCVLAVMERQTREGMDRLLEEARARQAERVLRHDVEANDRPRLAAKKAAPARKAIRHLPPLPGDS